jgi:hypothetical protein
MCRLASRSGAGELVVGWVVVNVVNLQRHNFGLGTEGALRACFLKNTLLQRLWQFGALLWHDVQ